MTKIHLPIISSNETFEDFIYDLYNFEYPNDNFQFFGKRGDKQHGIDLISLKKRVAIQCKKKEINRDNKQLLSELKVELEKSAIQALALKNDIDQLIFTSTFNDNSALIKYLLEIKSKHRIPYDLIYLGWQSIEQKAQKHNPLLKKYYSEIFGIQHFRTPIPFFDIHLLEGRKDLLNQIDEYASKYSAFVLHGLPGIGKTVLLSSYIISNRERYHSLLWIECQLDSLKNSILAKLSSIFNQNFDWNTLLQTLNSHSHKNLIVLDGFEIMDENSLPVIDDICSTGWKVIITSRVKISDYPVINVEGLPLDSAKLLFNKSFDRETDEESIEKIIVQVGCHPLLIELIAKSIQVNQAISLRQSLEILKDGDLHSKAFEQPISVGRHARKYSDKQEYQIFKYLMLCLNINHLSTAEIKQLTYFSILPQSEAITYNFYLSITGQKTSQKLIKSLNGLVYKGLITKRGEDYYIHPIVQIVIKEKIGIKVSKIKTIIYNCTKKLKDIREAPASKLQTYIVIARNILNATSVELDTVFLSQFFAIAMTRMGDYTRSVKYFEEGLEFLLLNGIDDINTINSFTNNLASAYGYTGEYDKAIGYFMNCLKYASELDEDDAISLARTLDNFATVLEKIGMYKDAQTLTIEAVNIFERYKSKSNLGIAYTNLANSFTFSRQIKKALKYWEKGFKLLRKYFDTDSLRFADSYNTKGLILLKINDPFKAKAYFNSALLIYQKEKNPDIIAMGYSHIGLCEVLTNDLEQAKIHFNQSLNLHKKIINGNQHNMANILLNFATYYIAKEEPKKALDFFRQAEEIYKEISLEDHPDAQYVKESIEKLSTHKGLHYCIQIKLKNLLAVLKQILKINLKKQQEVIDEYGETRYLKSNNQKDIPFDYIFFCFTKFTKTINAILILIDKGLPEDAMALLYSVYRNYLTINFVVKNPDLVQLFILYPSYDRMVDENNILNSLAYLDPKTKEERRVYPLLNKLIVHTARKEDAIVHSYLDMHLSDHAYSSFMAAGNFRNAKENHYNYKSDGMVLQAAYLCSYLQYITFDATLKFLNSQNIEVNKFRECFRNGIDLTIKISNTMEFDDHLVKNAMICRLENILIE
ncbi:MAG TPA: tetratricopeptide repeat protein [Mucilaginibacter sp.]|jgi:hypothetical protein|nr:tetratricopeptide repeat protein [Mucilaginibacter sp.]